MDIPPEGRLELVALALGGVVGLLVVELVVLPVALLAVEFVAGIVETVVRVITEPRRIRRSR
ncbi:hypothetical protein [Halomicrococcus gelatinilyticus]|uniref:hypothetical protein n=1 Tax=Halomicrococcus gelatinilyticus TaxID=1702103 RepID=UPI002E0DC52C